MAGGLRRKKQRGAKRISIIPIIVMSHGNPIAFAIAPPAEGPFRKQRIRCRQKEAKVEIVPLLMEDFQLTRARCLFFVFV